MAITKLESPVTPNPATAGVGGDWDLAMAQLTACKILLQGEQAILTEMDAFLNESTTIPKIAQGTYIQHLGAIYIVDTEDYTILGSPSAGANYIQIAVSGDNLTATWITSLTGYTWSADYQGAYDASNNMILPYVVMQVTGPLYYKYNINFNHKYFGGNVESVGDLTVGGLAAITGALSAASASITGALSAATLNTGQGANELYAMDQDVETNDTPFFTDMLLGKIVTAGSTTTIAYKSFDSSDNSSYEVVFSYDAQYVSGTVRFTFDIKAVSTRTAYWLVEKNGVEVDSGTETSTSYVAKTVDITVTYGDLIEFSLKTSAAGYNATASDMAIKIDETFPTGSVLKNFVEV